MVNGMVAAASWLNHRDTEDRPRSENLSCLNVAALESYGPPGLRGFLDGASRRQKGEQLRGKEDKRRKEGFEGFISL